MRGASLTLIVLNYPTYVFILPCVPSGCAPLADGEYDVIILGTGLKEAVISGLLSTEGLKVGGSSVVLAGW